jgi:phosphoribosylanthranilate isomerase
VAELRPLRVIKAVRVHGEELEADMERWAAARARHDLRNLAALLLESPPASPDGAPGGTGAENDWEAIAAVRFAEVIEELPAIVVAGGLTPANVGEVVRRLEPYAVDVSSGIESARGIKSLAKMAAFSYEVRAADQSR